MSDICECEPPSAKRHARWCERDEQSLLDYSDGSINREKFRLHFMNLPQKLETKHHKYWKQNTTNVGSKMPQKLETNVSFVIILTR